MERFHPAWSYPVILAVEGSRTKISVSMATTTLKTHFSPTTGKQRTLLRKGCILRVTKLYWSDHGLTKP